MSQPDREEGSQQTEGHDEILVACRCESAKAVATLLHCLRHVASGSSGGDASSAAFSGARDALYSQGPKQHRFASNISRSTGAYALQPVTVFCSPTSLTFHVHGRAKQMQASVDLQKGLFSHYQVVSAPPQSDDPDDAWQGGAGGEFCVNLTKVLECLHVLGGAASATLERTTLSFTYNSSTEIFCMELLEQDTGMLVSAAIPGMVPPDDDLGNSLALAFRSSPLAARIIVRSDVLREMVQELELVSGATHATVWIGTSGLELAAVGHLGECVVSVPPKGPHVVSLEVHDVGQPKASSTAPAGEESSSSSPPRSYPLHSLLASMRGLEIAQETCLTVNSAGMMAIQHQVVDAIVGDGNPNFVDFILCCMEDEEADEEATTDGGTTTGSPGTTRRDRVGATVNGSPGTTATNDGTRSVRSRRNGVRRDYDDENSTSSDDDDRNDDGRSMQSSLPLFGSVVNSANASLTASSPEADSVVRREEGGNGGGIDDSDADPLSPDTRWNGPKRRRRDRSFASSGRRRDLAKDRPATRLTRSKQQQQAGRPRDREDNDNDDDDDSSSNSSTIMLEGHGGGDNEGNEVAGSQPMDDADFARSSRQRLAGSRHPGDRDGDCSSPELVYGRQEYE